MSKLMITDSLLTGIADAIRGKNGSSDQYTPAQMATAISNIPTGTTPTGTVNITQNGTVDVTQYASAAVAVPNSYGAGDEGKVVSNGALVAQTARASEITANGTYDTTANNSVMVSVPYAKPSGSVHIWTHTTGSRDASVYVQHGTWNTEHTVFTPDEEKVDILYTDVQGASDGLPTNPYIANGIVTLYYSTGWKTISNVPVIYNNMNYSAMTRVVNWSYANTIDYYIDCA